MALIFATNGLASMMSAFDATVHSINRRSLISQRLAATLLLFILTILLTVAIVLLTSGQDLINYLETNEILRDSFTIFLISAGKWVVTVSLFFFSYSFLYYMAPAKKTKWRFISAGGTLATVLSIGTLASFTYYIKNTHCYLKYNKSCKKY